MEEIQTRICNHSYSANQRGQIREGKLLIGSPYVSNLVAINLETGQIERQDPWADFLDRNYPEILARSPDELKTILAAQDVFTKSIPIYTYDGLKILHRYCEELGYPNCTHDGLLMYEDSFSTDWQQVVGWAQESHKCRIERIHERIKETRQELEQWERKLAELMSQKFEIN